MKNKYLSINFKINKNRKQGIHAKNNHAGLFVSDFRGASY